MRRRKRARDGQADAAVGDPVRRPALRPVVIQAFEIRRVEATVLEELRGEHARGPARRHLQHRAVPRRVRAWPGRTVELERAGRHRAGVRGRAARARDAACTCRARASAGTCYATIAACGTGIAGCARAAGGASGTRARIAAARVGEARVIAGAATRSRVIAGAATRSRGAGVAARRTRAARGAPRASVRIRAGRAAAGCRETDQDDPEESTCHTRLTRFRWRAREPRARHSVRKRGVAASPRRPGAAGTGGARLLWYLVGCAPSPERPRNVAKCHKYVAFCYVFKLRAAWRARRGGAARLRRRGGARGRRSRAAPWTRGW